MTDQETSPYSVTIIESFSDLEGRLGVDYQKTSEGLQAPRLTALPTIHFSRCSSVFEVLAPRSSQKFVLDAYVFAVVAPNINWQLRGVTSISDAVNFYPTPALVEAVSHQYNIDIRHCLASLTAMTILPRTNWLNEIMHRYVYERVIARNRNNTATEFLESEILKEVFYRLEEQSRLDKSRFDLDKSAMDLRNPELRAAMDYIEANLFRDITVTDIAAQLDISESTLLREFQVRLKKSPQAYLLDRRLEEAMVLLKSQRYAVSQVSDIVGYENLSSFSAAFKKKFNLTPSQVITKDPKELLDRVTTKRTI